MRKMFSLAGVRGRKSLFLIMSNPVSFAEQLAVCSWSLQPTDPRDLVEKVSRTGLNTIQIALDPLLAKPLVWGEIGETVSSAGMRLVSGMFGTIGEDYSSLESIRRTGGLVPDATWEANWENIQKHAQVAEALGLPLVTFHAGFLPANDTDPKFPILIDRLRRVADLFGERGIELGLETGQETAHTLEHFLQELDRPNVGVNFDPANMLIYNTGDPIESLVLLLPRLKQCHIKDASRPAESDDKGREEPVGVGEVNWRLFLITLRKARYEGSLVIERERGDNRIADIRRAAELVRNEGEPID